MPSRLRSRPDGHTINGSEVMAGGAEVWSAYRAHEDGLGRIAVIVDRMSPHELGRTVERLLTIENSYHLILLSLRLARELNPSLAAAERRMVSVNDALLGADSVVQKRALLDSLFRLAAEVEHLKRVSPTASQPPPPISPFWKVALGNSAKARSNMFSA
jgi:uncharacterized membrane-anchored protein